MRQRYLKIGMLVLVLALAVVLVVRALPSQSDRLVQRVAQALNEGRIEEADESLAELAEITRDSMDLTGIMSIRLGLSAARIARDNQMSVEYQTLAFAFPEEDELHQTYLQLSDAYRDKLPLLTEEMMDRARIYRGQHFQSGLRLKSPLEGTLHLPSNNPDLDAAYWSLLDGQSDQENHDVLQRSIAREVAGVILRLIIVQDDGEGTSEALNLSGNLDLAELLWLLGTNSNSPLFTQWCLNQILEETANDPDHPARQRALEALDRIVHF